MRCIVLPAAVTDALPNLPCVEALKVPARQAGVVTGSSPVPPISYPLGHFGCSLRSKGCNAY
jgi:hypothetical protein